MQTKDKAILCPLCVKPTVLLSDVSALPLNHYLGKFTSLLESLPVVEIQTGMCNKHHTEMFFWCQTCAQQACIHCLGLLHRPENKHVVMDRGEAHIQLLDQAKDLLESMKARGQQVESLHQHLMVTRMAELPRRASQAMEQAIAAPTLGLPDPKPLANQLVKWEEQLATDADIGKVHFTLTTLQKLQESQKDLLSFLEQKKTESDSLCSSSIVTAFFRSDLSFDFGRLYCPRCGKFCDLPRRLNPGPGNPYGTKAIQHLCQPCGVSLLQFNPKD